VKLKHYREAAFRAAWRRAIDAYRKRREEWWTLDDAPPFDSWFASQGAQDCASRAISPGLDLGPVPSEKVDPARSCAVYGLVQNLEKPKKSHGPSYVSRAHDFDDPRRADMLALVGTGRVMQDTQARGRVVDTRLVVDGRQVVVVTSVFRMWQRRGWLEPDAESDTELGYIAWRVASDARGGDE
jgi:hypothetical protein